MHPRMILTNPSGYANILRLNGEPAQEYRARLQTRLGQLAALDTYIVSEVETIRGKMQKTIKLMKDIEIRRMQVDLQVYIPFMSGLIQLSSFL